MLIIKNGNVYSDVTKAYYSRIHDEILVTFDPPVHTPTAETLEEDITYITQSAVLFNQEL